MKKWAPAAYVPSSANRVRLGIRLVNSPTVVVLIATLLAAGCTRHYPVEGVVLRTAADRREVVVSHGPIPGYMDAMAMPFAVRDPALLQNVVAGDRVRFDLTVTATSSVIESLAIISAPRADPGLQRIPAVSRLVPIGQPFPDFSLQDQHGNAFTLSGLQGQVVLVTFIYTRCPLPDYCPLLMANFARIKKEFTESLGKGLALVTITFDPQYDTSEVLSRYGAKYGAEDGGWYLLTGSKEQVREVTELFGIEFYPDEGMITHSMLTTVIAPDGRLFAALEGKNYSIEQLADVVRAARRQSLP